MLKFHFSLENEAIQTCKIRENFEKSNYNLFSKFIVKCILVLLVIHILNTDCNYEFFVVIQIVYTGTSKGQVLKYLNEF